MAESVIESLLVKIGIDAQALQAGLERASAAIKQVAATAEASGDGLDRMALTASKGALLVGRVSDDVAGRVMEIGTAGQKAAVQVSRAMDQIGERASGVVGVLKSLGGPLLAAFGGAQLFQSFTAEGDALAKLSDRLGVSAQKIDAWAKANEDAGGSQEAFKSALENFVLTTGKGEKEFFRMGEHVKGLSQRQAEYFLQAQGLSADAAAVFLKYREGAEQAARAFDGVAMTDEQVKIARQFNREWKWFTNQASSLGGILLTVVMPALSGTLKAISGAINFLNEHSRAVKVVGGLVAAVFGASYLKNFLGASKAVGTLLSVLKGGIPVAKAFSAALAANPVGVFMAAVAALGLVLEDFFAFLEGGPSLFGSFLSFIGFSEKSVDNFRASLNSFIGAIKGIPAAVVNALGSAWAEIKAVGRGLANLFKLDAVADGLRAAFEGISTVAGGVGKALLTGLRGVVSLIDYLADGVAGIPDAFVKGFSHGISYLYETFVGAFIDPIKAALQALFELDFSSIKDSASKMADKAVDTVKGWFGFGGEEKKEAPRPRDRKVHEYSWDGGDFFGALPVDYSSEALASARAALAAPLAASAAASGAAPSVKNSMQVTVETHIQTDSDPTAVAQAVQRGATTAMTRAQDLIANASTGVVQKG